MRAVGLKGNYFTLHAISATVAALKNARRRCVVLSLLGRLKKLQSAAKEGDAPPEAAGLLSAAPTPCHCCLIFTRKSHLALYRNRFLKRFQLDHGHRESGLSPPTSL